MQIILDMDDNDFERLTSTSMQWGESWSEHEGRWETTTSDPQDKRQPRLDWAMAYWVKDDWAQVMMCRAFLKARGFDCEIFWDLAFDIETEEGEYVILCDYKSPVWVKSERRTQELEARFNLPVGSRVESKHFTGAGTVLDFSTADPKTVQVLVVPDVKPADRAFVTVPVNDVWKVEG